VNNVLVNNVWRLHLATMGWEAMPALRVARLDHACCAVRSSLVVIGGQILSDDVTGSVEMFAEGGVALPNQPPCLSCGGIGGAAAIAVDESDSAAGQVLLLGEFDEDEEFVSTVYLVDLATDVGTPQPNLLHARGHFAAARLPDGRIVCAGGGDSTTVLSSAEVLEPPVQGALDTAWACRELPAMIVARDGCRECVLSDGRFAVLGGEDIFNNEPMSACEALLVGDDEHWEMLPPMHEARSYFACAALARCIVVAGGHRGRDPLGCFVDLRSAEVFDEVFDRWLWLPCNLPYDNGLIRMGSALL